MLDFDEKLRCYEPYIKVTESLIGDRIVENYIKNNYASIIVEQFEEYKKDGIYKRAGDFIKEKLQSELKNPDAFYNEIKRGESKDVTNIVPKLKEFPVVKRRLSEVGAQFDKRIVNVRDSLILGREFLLGKNISRNSNILPFLLWIFVNNYDYSKVTKYESEILKDIAQKIRYNLSDIDEIIDNDFDIPLQNYKEFIDINNFKKDVDPLDLYIKLNYPEIIKDEFEVQKKNKIEKERRKKYTRVEFIEDHVVEHYNSKGTLYYSLSTGRRKMDEELLEKFRKFSILHDSESTHYKNIENFKYVRLALGLGAISLEVPILIHDITKAVEQTNLQALSGKQYLEVLSDNLEKVAEELYEEYQWHEEQNRIEQYYSDNLKIK
ncbi:MAG: hypothetical protein E6693_01150 [Streptococcus mitis]|jgi:hypothetical protein|nr:hypothetical protein [Streptococcus mitis]